MSDKATERELKASKIIRKESIFHMHLNNVTRSKRNLEGIVTFYQVEHILSEEEIEEIKSLENKVFESLNVLRAHLEEKHEEAEKEMKDFYS